jgi:hypothetical protein
VLWQTVRVVAAGLLVGVVVALCATRMASSMLFGVDSRDPATVLQVLGFVSTLAVLSSLWPVCRMSDVTLRILGPD